MLALIIFSKQTGRTLFRLISLSRNLFGCSNYTVEFLSNSFLHNNEKNVHIFALFDDMRLVFKSTKSFGIFPYETLVDIQ